MSGQGNSGIEVFVEALRAAGTDRSVLLARQLATPVRVSVTGRPGVGVRTVARALGCAGVPIAEPADVAVRVIAEVPKPEDLAIPAASMLILNKADLGGLGGPEVVGRRCAELTRRTGVRTLPMIGVLAVAVGDPTIVDAQVFAALQTLTTAPADLTSPDAFLGGHHELAVPVRRILAERLDMFGIASAVLALRSAPGIDAAGLRRALRAASGIEGVCAEIAGAVARERYRRLLAATAELEGLAGCNAAAAAFVTGATAAGARAAAAAEVLGGAIGGDVRAAVRWRSYADGPVSALHRAAADDLMRATLRRWTGSVR